MSDAIEAERKRAIAAIHWVFNADGTVGERAMAQEAIHKINDPTFMPALTAYEAAKGGGVGVAALLDAYDAETSKLPLGHETPSHGRSTFNWRRAVVAELRDLSATLALTSPASGSGTREEIKGAVGRETEGWPAETDHVPSPASGERDAATASDESGE